MLRSPRSLLLLAALALIGPAAGAQAATFSVDANAGTSTPGCQDAAHPCKTIGAAVGAARGVTGPNTIEVAPGTYVEDLELDNAGDSGLTIEGSGGRPLIQKADSALAAVDLGADAAHVTLRHLAVTVPAGAGDGKSGVVAGGQDTTVADVVVRTDPTTSTAPTVSIASGGAGPFRLDHLDVHQATAELATPALAVRGSGLTTLADSTVAGLGLDYGVQGVWTNTSLQVVRSRISLPRNGIGQVLSVQGLQFGAASLTVDTSLVTGGNDGVTIDADPGKGTAAATVRDSTIDSGSPGNGSGGGYSAIDAEGEGVASATVTRSILVDAIGSGTGATTCTDSDVPPRDGDDVRCGPADGNAYHGEADLFVNDAAGDFHLKPGSPARDAAQTTDAQAATDIDGAPRDVDSDFNCVARPDRGAFEMQDAINTPPSTPQIAAPADGAAAAALSFAAAATDAEGGALTYRWTFTGSDDHPAGAAVSHAFAAPGPQTASVTATDPHGCSSSASAPVAVSAAAQPSPTPTPTPSPAADTTAPRISHVRLTRRGVTVTLSEPARLSGKIVRKGHKRAAAKPGKPLAAGRHTIRFAHRLRPGRYRLRLAAVDAAGNRSKVINRTVRVKRK